MAIKKLRSFEKRKLNLSKKLGIVKTTHKKKTIDCQFFCHKKAAQKNKRVKGKIKPLLLTMI